LSECALCCDAVRHSLISLLPPFPSAVLQPDQPSEPVLAKETGFAKRLFNRCDRAMDGPASSQPALPRACTRRPQAVFFSLRVRLPTVRNEGQRSPDPSARKPGRKRADLRPAGVLLSSCTTLSWLYYRWRFQKLVKIQQVFKAPFALESIWTTPVFFGRSRCLCFRN
jgi:hypothetical protein